MAIHDASFPVVLYGHVALQGREQFFLQIFDVLWLAAFWKMHSILIFHSVVFKYHI